MARRIAPQSEVAGRADQSLAEVPLPRAIDEHPRGQGILGVGDRSGAISKSAAAVLKRSTVGLGEQAAGNRRGTQPRPPALPDCPG